MSGDALWANVVLLTAFDGADGATTVTDESSAANGAATFVGNAQLDTAQQKFGSASLLLDGTGDYVTWPDDADWQLDGDFTIEGFIRYNSVASNESFASHYTNTGNQRAWWLRWQTTNMLEWVFSTDGAATTTRSGAWTPVADTWYHWAVERVGTALVAYIDGVAKISSTMVGTTFNSNAPLRIGFGESSDDMPTNGWIDEVRITKGAARYNGAFTPPSEAFPRGVYSGALPVRRGPNARNFASHLVR